MDRFALLPLILLPVLLTGSPPLSAAQLTEGQITEWLVVGPFPNPERTPGSEDRGAFDTDYLEPAGGEAGARITPGLNFASATARRVSATDGLLNFISVYPESDHKLAYAYTEINAPRAGRAYIFLGSDDGVKLWLNGKLEFETLPEGGRGFMARSDCFPVRLREGTNRLLAKVENGLGDWGLLVEIFSEAAGKKILAQMESVRKIKAFQRQDVGLASDWPGYVFNPAWGGIPRIVWRDADEVRRLAGPVPLTVRWFDRSLNEVKTPEKPGSYIALVEGHAKSGMSVKRALTFVCGGAGTDWAGLLAPSGTSLPYPGEPMDKKTWDERGEQFAQAMGQLASDALWQTPAGAVLIAALLEAKPLGRSPVYTDSPSVTNDQWHLDLKLKLMGITGKTRPLAPPRQIAQAAPVIRDGNLAEARMKPDAKQKIDEVCRQWAGESNEPFTILVARNGVIVTHEAFGGVGLDYRTDVMSITKALTGMLFGRFLDQGYCSLEDPIGRTFPGFPTSGPRMLTYRHLLAHTSGLEGHGEWGGIHNVFLDNVVLNGLDALQPGRAYIYNGMGFDLTARAMEYMTGSTIVRLFHDGLFRPLGLDDIRVDDCAYGANLTARDLAVMGQMLANHGRYGTSELMSEETFQKLLPVSLERFFPGVKEVYGVGLSWMPEHKPGSEAPILSPRTIGHGSASSCILRVDLERGLVIAQIRRTAGSNYADFAPRFYQAIADSLL